MRIRLTSLMVDDQDKALAFYTNVLGFKKKQEIPMGPYRWLSVVSPEEPEGAELSLEPNANPAGRASRGCRARTAPRPVLTTRGCPTG